MNARTETENTGATGNAQIYLVTPERLAPEAMAELIARAIEAVDVACVRLDLGRLTDEDEWRRAANHLIPVCHGADIALIIAEHHRLVRPLGLDGVHLGIGTGSVRAVRKELGGDAIIGAEGGTERHRAMSLAEAGADYVSLGPVADTGALGNGALAEPELFQWWSEMIETPVVAEGGIRAGTAAAIAPFAEFIVPDRRIWSDPDGGIAELTEIQRLLETASS